MPTIIIPMCLHIYTYKQDMEKKQKVNSLHSCLCLDSHIRMDWGEIFKFDVCKSCSSTKWHRIFKKSTTSKISSKTLITVQTRCTVCITKYFQLYAMKKWHSNILGFYLFSIVGFPMVFCLRFISWWIMNMIRYQNACRSAHIS